jgi:hypothetical protein
MIISPDFVAYEQKYAAVSALRAESLPLNKSALFDALAAAAIQTVVIEFDGCGDSGQLENITGLGVENTEIPLPEDEIEMHEVQFEDPSTTGGRTATAPMASSRSTSPPGQSH